MTSQIHVALEHDLFRGKGLHHQFGVRIEQIVVMPRPAVSMHEEGNIGQVGVVGDDVGEVGHYFLAFIGGDIWSRVRVINGVNGKGEMRVVIEIVIDREP